MKLAFVSDIHSNIYAFKTVLRFLEKKNVDQIYIAGDLLSYYYNAADVVERAVYNIGRDTAPASKPIASKLDKFLNTDD